MSKKSVAFILNLHLPYVRHLEYPRFLEEDWLFESISESYLPMLRMFYKLREEKVPYNLTVSISPTVMCMLTDEALQNRFNAYMELHRDLGEKEIARCSSEQPEFLEMAHFYLEQLKQNLTDFNDLFRGNILDGFKSLEVSGHLELITTAATHAFLPLYQEYPTAINAQVELAIQSFLTTFGHVPKGFWLPECGYYPGLEETLKYHGITWFQVASQSMLLSPDKVKCGDYRPIRCPNGVVAFPRDYQATSLVWSNTSGYPCDRNYREFYRDIGYDLPMPYIGEYIHEPGVRVFTGFKYWAITGNTDQKRPYDRSLAQKKIVEHAHNFLYNLEKKGDELSSCMGNNPLYTLGFDAELFGHWWFEGIAWLEQVLVLSSKKDEDVTLVTPSSFLAKEGESLQVARPAGSSWGQGGYSSVWLDGSNAWTYRHIHKAIERMEELSVRFSDQISLKQRFLNQAAREVLLSMASDWPFILYNKTSSEYAQKRLTDHLRNFNVVYGNMCKNAVNTEWLVKAEKRDILFPDIDYNIFNPER